VTIHANQEAVAEVVEKIYQNIYIEEQADVPQLIHDIITA
jgi:pyrimidine-nucleoside phosphorylase